MASTEEEYFMIENLDLLTRIEAYAKNIDANLAVLGDIMLDTGATIEKLVTGAPGKAAPNTATGGNIDKLVSKIDTLISTIEKGGTGSGGITITSESIGKLGENVLTFSKGLSASVPLLKKTQSSLAFITQSITDFIRGLAHNIDDDSVNKASKAAAIIGSMTNTIGKFGTELLKSIIPFKLAGPFIPYIGRTVSALVISLVKNVDEKIDFTKAEQIGKTVESLSGSVLKLAKHLVLAAPLLLIAAPGLLILRFATNTISNIATKLGGNANNISTASKLINKIAFSMIAFSGGLALSAMILGNLSLSNAGALFVLFGSMALAVNIYSNMGKNTSGVMKGSLVLLAMAGVTAIFALALNKAAEYMPDVTSVLGTIGAIVGFGVILGVIGRHADDIGAGAIALGLMGLSTLLFGYALAKLEPLMKPELVAGSLLALTGFALVFGIAGKFWPEIAFGALAFAAVGLALMLIASPLASISASVAQNEGVLWKLPLMLTGIAAAFALAGVGIELILPGALAVAAIGGGLWVLAKGVAEFAKIPTITEEQALGFEYGIRGIVNGMGGAFRDLSLTEIAMLPITIPILLGMGMAMGAIGFGLRKYKDIAGDWSKDDASALSFTLSSLSSSFALAGSSDGMTKIFGFPVGKNDVQRGIDTTMAMGRNLQILATGIKKWRDMDLKPGDIQIIADNISRVINTIPAVFASVGKNARGSSNQMTLFGVTFGVPFTNDDVETGIESTMKMGRNLKNLADGVIAWKTMKLTTADVQLISDNVGKVINTIPAVFASVGKRARGSSNQFSLFGINFGVPFTDDDVETGIESTMKMGHNLKYLAEGIMAWKDGGSHGFKLSDIPGIQANIKGILDSIPFAFASLGKADKKTEGILWGDGDVERGVDLVNSMEPALKSVMGLFNTFKGVPNVVSMGAQIGQGIRYLFTGLNAGLLSMKDSEVARLERLMKPLDKLITTFKGINAKIKEQMDMITKMSPQGMDNFKVWAESLEKLSNINPSGFDGSAALQNRLAGQQPTQVYTAPYAPSIPSRQSTQNAATAANTQRLENMIMQLTDTLSQFMKGQSEQTLVLQGIKTQLQKGIKTTEVSSF